MLQGHTDYAYVHSAVVVTGAVAPRMGHEPPAQEEEK